MPAFIDLTECQFGRLTVIKRVPPPFGKRTRGAYWQCICECGAESIVMSQSLVKGSTRSCGCYGREVASEIGRRARTTHGLSKTTEYCIWSNLRDRCHNPNGDAYKDYGGRGIKVCSRWDDFSAFIADVGKRPSKRHTLDRINNDGNYEPGNVRWATRSEQNNNKRSNRLVTYRGVTMTLNQALTVSGRKVDRMTATSRIRSGWTIDSALEMPPQRLAELAAAFHSQQNSILADFSFATYCAA